MTRIPLPFLLLAACSQPPAAPSLPLGSFAGEGRDRLCIAGEPGNYRAGLISYGSADTNCSARGQIEVGSDGVALVPRGEGPCRIALVVEGDRVSIGKLPAACSYYCGPGADMAGKSFRRTAGGGAALDLVGDPLC